MNRKWYGAIMLVILYLVILAGMSFALGFWPALIILTGSVLLIVWVSVAASLLATGKCWS